MQVTVATLMYQAVMASPEDGVRSFLRPNHGSPPLEPTLSLCLERHPMV